MNRIYEEIESTCVFAPASVNASTETTSAFVSASMLDSIDFHVVMASLANTKKLKVGIYAGDNASGDNAVKIDETEFVATAALTNVLAIASVQVDGSQKAYYGVKFQHDSDAAVICSVTANGRTIYRPADNIRVLSV